MFYKIIRDNEVVDALDYLQYVRVQRVDNSLICCPAQYGQGILGSNGEDKWYSSGYVAGANVNSYPEVEIIGIEENEYSEIKAVLDEGKAIYEPEETVTENVTVEPEETAQENAVAEPQAKTINEKIKELSKTTDMLGENFDMLTECILEMSGVIYG